MSDGFLTSWYQLVQRDQAPKRLRITKQLVDKYSDLRASDLSENVLIYSHHEKVFVNQNAGGRDPNIEEDHVHDVHKRRPESTLLLQGACAMAVDALERDGTPNRSPHIAEVNEHPSLTVDKLRIEATDEKDCDMTPIGHLKIQEVPQHCP